ncbi:MAG: hypothetical protein WC866_04385 [Patescibacteria group bacterium]
MLDPWVIEKILERERERQRRQEGEQPRVPADDPRENPDTDPREKTPKPGYEMPNQDGSKKPDTGDRGVADIPLGEMDIPKEDSDAP